jgi:FixJ family two-component response regulator
VTARADKPTVFVVDDDEAVRRSLAALIRLFNYSVECYSTAAEFLAAYNDRRGCLVLDVRLVGSSGIDLHEQLTRNGVSIPAIFVTGHAPPPITDEARRRGVVAVFQKPFRPQNLMEAIRQATAEDPDSSSA